MKTIHFKLIIVFLFSSVVASSQSVLNPQGTYVLVATSVVKDGDTYGYFGEIQVKKFTPSKIIMTFYICKGAPSYNSGSFVDTLTYKNNQANYIDESCNTEFTFTKYAINVKEKSNGSCWGANVVAHGLFKKKSSKEPILTDPLSGERLK